LYSSKPSYVLGFHGLDVKIGRKILNGVEDFQHSTNIYDWLGHGVYFWENSPERAKQWAEQQVKWPGSKVKKPFVIGAIIEPKTCLDLLDQKWIDYLRSAHKQMKISLKEAGKELPVNQPWGADDIDFKKRDLDCAVIRFAIQWAKDMHNIEIDSVRSVFWEGKKLYPKAGFRTHNHIQLSVINPDCIKGVFLPRQKKQISF
jgi:hypothetical protein